MKKTSDLQDDRIHWQCPICANQHPLDPYVYANYKGEVRCWDCKALLSISFNDGDLQSTPKIISKISAELKYVPTNILHDLNEAEMCFSIKATTACVILCRRALESVCVDKKAIGSTLYDQIKDLLEKGLISKDTFQYFEEIRLFGNYGAHPTNDLLDDVSIEDAEIALEITTHIIKHIYEMLGKITKLTEKRKNKKG
jgi:hypothetical protein